MTANKTPLYDEHVALGARIVEFAGWQMPVQYSGLVAEHQAVRAAAGLFDVSHMGELIIEGARAEERVDALVTADLTQLAEGRAVYCMACNEEGTILDDLIVYRLGEERFMVVCNASNRGKIAAHFRTELGTSCSFEDASDRYALIALQGPHAEAIMRSLGAHDIASLTSFGLTETTLGTNSIIAARTGYTAEDGFEIFCSGARAVSVWRMILEAGRSRALLPIGLGARDTLRLEGRLSLYGNEIDETTNPLEAGIGRFVKLDSRRDFLGKSALIRIRDAGLSRKLVGFEMVGRGAGRHGYPVVEWRGSDDVVPLEPAGRYYVTSGCPSPTLQKSIGLAYIPADRAEVGTSFGIEIRGKAVEARVVKTPFYRRAT